MTSTLRDVEILTTDGQSRLHNRSEPGEKGNLGRSGGRFTREEERNELAGSTEMWMQYDPTQPTAPPATIAASSPRTRC